MKMTIPGFSARTNWDLQPTAYADALNKLRRSGEDFFDLTASNPTACGFQYDDASILRELAQPGCLRYEPDPRGLVTAREAVARYYADAGANVSAAQILLTTSTSEAYSYLFRLHCDPGDEVLIAQPSYPLFDFLAGLESVRLVPYPLFYDHGWHLDAAALEARITPCTRAVVVVHPNNPTGHFTKPNEREALEALCAKHGLPLIVDEVFLDYAMGSESAAQSPRSFVCGEHPVLTYVLSGLSKVAALPQMKGAWIATCGPEGPLSEAQGRLEVIADTFLSIGAPVQHAMLHLLGNRHGIQQQIHARVHGNLAVLDHALANAPMLSHLKLEGGWYVVLRVPALASGEVTAVRLMEERQVVIHPGYFYGFDGDGWVVLSLLPTLEVFAEGIQRFVRFFK